MSNDDSISLNKYISQTGFCSRRQADELIRAGRVKINGKSTKPGNRVFDGDVVTVDDDPVGKKPKPVYIVLNKPQGIVCTTSKTEKNNVIDYIDYHQRIFPVGRLDKDSEGLLLLTNDGDIVNKLLRSANKHEKEYLVTVNRPITDKFLENMSNGVQILNTRTKPCTVAKVGKKTFRIILTQGLNRQIRRMCTHLGYEVKHLMRLRILDIQLGHLKLGAWRKCSDHEVRSIMNHLKHSTNKPKAKPKSKPNPRHRK